VRGQVLNDLAHRSSFIGPTKSAVIEILDYVDHRQIARLHILLCGCYRRTLDIQLGGIKAIRQHTDRNAVSLDPALIDQVGLQANVGKSIFFS
jgi:hypothetical protein